MVSIDGVSGISRPSAAISDSQPSMPEFLVAAMPSSMVSEAGGSDELQSVTLVLTPSPHRRSMVFA